MSYKTIEDFLMDDSFIQWVLQPNEVLNLKWNSYIKEHPKKEGKIKQAKNLLMTIHTNTVSEYTQEINDEKRHLIWLRIQKAQIKTKHKGIKRLVPFNYRVAAAAVLVGVLATAYMLRGAIFNLDHVIDNSPIIVNNQIETGTDKATLTLETGEEVTLEKGTNYQTATASSNGEEIIYLPVRQTGLPTGQVGTEAPKGQKPKAKSSAAQNTLTTPRGGQFQMVLADGTKVWLNSESQLKYPVAFTEGQTRQVELVYGEAYFDVSPSVAHKGSDFKVYHKDQEVQVLGTQFNIKAYKDETNIYTTLAEGRVSVTAGINNKRLSPTQQSNLDVTANIMNITVVDVYNETSWREGVFSFKRKTLKNIMQVLSRWYDMDVIFEDKSLETKGFNGVLGKEQSIQEILKAIKDFGVIKNYEINNKTIVLK